MEEDIVYLKELLALAKMFLNNNSIVTIQDKEIQVLEDLLNELERLQRDNNALEMTHNYDIRMIDEVKGEYVKLSKEFKTLKNDSIPKQVIRDKFKRINETKIKIDKTNARDYMIFGDTERATGWFINIDYIEKILLDVPGYKIGDE